MWCEKIVSAVAVWNSDCVSVRFTKNNLDRFALLDQSPKLASVGIAADASFSGNAVFNLSSNLRLTDELAAYSHQGELVHQENYPLRRFHYPYVPISLSFCTQHGHDSCLSFGTAHSTYDRCLSFGTAHSTALRGLEQLLRQAAVLHTLKAGCMNGQSRQTSGPSKMDMLSH